MESENVNSITSKKVDLTLIIFANKTVYIYGKHALYEAVNVVVNNLKKKKFTI